MSASADVLRVRAMRLADIEAVLAIAGEVPEAPRRTAADYEAACHRPGDNRMLRLAAFVAETGGGIAGFALTRLLLDGEQNACELESIAVGPGARRNGAGTRLLEAVAHWARAEGARRVELEVRAGNIAAIGLYERFGLAREGLRRGYYRGPEEDAVLMGIALADTDLGAE